MPISMAVHASISLGLDFSPGVDFAKAVWRSCHPTVHPSDQSTHFIMVVSFARHSFRLSKDNVALALEAAIGGYCFDLMVSCIKDRVFSFNVSCKQVRFFILHQRNFVCPQFKCFFYLWGHGGPDWEKEFRLWQKECDEEWTLVSPTKHRASLGLNALRKTPARSSLRSSSSAHGSAKHLHFATFDAYDACKGYRYRAKSSEIAGVIEAGYKLEPHEQIPAPQEQSSSPPATRVSPAIRFGSLSPRDFIGEIFGNQRILNPKFRPCISGMAVLPQPDPVESLGSVSNPLELSNDDSSEPIMVTGPGPMTPTEPVSPDSMAYLSPQVFVSVNSDMDISPASPIFLVKSPQEIVWDLQGLDLVVEHIAARFWDCQDAWAWVTNWKPVQIKFAAEIVFLLVI